MKKLLIVVDFQNDFVSGSLGFPGANNLEKIIYKKVMEYKNNSHDVIYTLDTHDEKYLNTVEGSILPIIHCVKGSGGHELYGEIKNLIDRDSIVFEKSTFGSLDLGIYLKDKDYKEIEICGLVSNICVISNAVIAKSAKPDTLIVVDALATASSDDDLHNKALDVLAGLHVKIKNRS